MLIQRLYNQRLQFPAFQMKKTPKTTQKIRDLVHLLQNPRKQPNRRISQPMVDIEQVRKNMRLRWKDAGFCNIQFQRPPGIKAKVLNQWQIERIHMATRSFKTPKQSRPYKFDEKSREFPKLSTNIYPVKFQRYLKQIQAENEDLLFKEKRAKTIKTQGRYPSQMNESKDQGCDKVFQPVSTATSYFGFSCNRDGKSKYTASHFKTLNI